MNTKTTLLPLLILLLVPITAYAYTVNEDFNSSVDDFLGGLLDIYDSVGIVIELYEAHADLSAIMELQSQGDFSVPDYPFVMTYVDGDELVVMMHDMAALAGIEYEEEEIQIALDADIPIEIIYGEFVLETSQSSILSWQQYYIDYCSPVQAGYRTVCILYGDRLRDEGIHPDCVTIPEYKESFDCGGSPLEESLCYRIINSHISCLNTWENVKSALDLQ